ncbi:MAG TPA: hypothetical protein VF885_12635 [Arthrobacter sp.]
MAQKRPPAPKDLKAPGIALWKSIAHHYPMRPDELKILRDACKAADMQSVLEEDIASTPLKTTGSMGQEVINGAIPEWRQYSNILCQLLMKLKLQSDNSDEEEMPRSRQSAARKTSATVAARERWGTG